MLLVMCGCTILAWVPCPSSRSMCGRQFELFVLEVASYVLTLTFCQIGFLHGTYGFGRYNSCMHLVGILVSGSDLLYLMVVLQIPSLSTLLGLVRRFSFDDSKRPPQD